jgi:hypothetical protein
LLKLSLEAMAMLLFSSRAVYARAGFAPLAKPDKWMALQ